MTSMPKPRPPFVQREVSRHGKVTWYFRRGDGPRIRLPSPYSEGFDAAYRTALNGTRPAPAAHKASSGTLGWLIQRYMETSDFAGYAKITQRNRGAMLRSVAKENGGIALSDIDRSAIQQGIDRRSIFAARNFLKALRPMFAWAVAADHVSADPTEGVRLPRAKKSEGYHTWTPEEVRLYEERHPLGTMPRLAMDLMLYTGLRRQDAIAVGRQHMRDGWLAFRAHKNGAMIERPILSPLAASIEASQLDGLTLLRNGLGEAFASPAAFGNWFRDRCVEAGVPGRAHGLRKAGAVIAAERGATTRQLMAIFGWESAAEAERYTREASRRKLAAEVSKLLEENGE